MSSGEKFQSTLPARGATLRADGSKSGYTHFNPRSPHGERQVILIVWACASLFQSTLPARGATHQGVLCRCKVRKISIHAPRTGSDDCPQPADSHGSHFNPRSPHGERRSRGCSRRRSAAHFNPRSPHGERRQGARKASVRGYFNPRSPHGERPCPPGGETPPTTFQSTLPARGATLIENFRKTAKTFQSTLPARGATGAHGCTWLQPRYFNPRSPHGERPDRQQLNAVN